MSVVVIKYDQLEKAAKQAVKTAKELDDYRNLINRVDLNSLDSCNLRPSAHYSQCGYYVKKKKLEIAKKSSEYRTFAARVSEFAEYAELKDQNVARRIAKGTSDFVDKHDYVEYGLKEAIRSFFVDLKNKNPIVNYIVSSIEYSCDLIKTAKEEIKYWYKCDGGREIIKVVIAAVLFVVAAVALLVSGGGILATIGALLTLFNAAANTTNAIKAHIAKEVNNDLAWSRIYSDRNTLADTIRETNYHNKKTNRLMNYSALGLDIVQIVCDIGGCGKAFFGEMKMPKTPDIITDAISTKAGIAEHTLDWVFDGNTGDVKKRFHKAGKDIFKIGKIAKYNSRLFKGGGKIASTIGDYKAIKKDISTINGLNGDYPYKHELSYAGI